MGDIYITICPQGEKKYIALAFPPFLPLLTFTFIFIKFSQTVHLLQRVGLASTHDMENKCKDLKKKKVSPFTPLCLTAGCRCLSDQKSERSAVSCDDLTFSSSISREIQKKFPRGPWPLNVRHRVSFPLPRREVHLLFPGCSMWRVQEGVASERKLLNKAFEYWIWDGFHCSRHSYGRFWGGFFHFWTVLNKKQS